MTAIIGSLFAWAMGVCFGVSIGLLLSVLFENWSRRAAEWIIAKWKESRND